MEQIHLRPGLKFIITVLPRGTAAEKKIQGSADGNNFQREGDPLSQRVKADSLLDLMYMERVAL